MRLVVVVALLIASPSLAQRFEDGKYVIQRRHVTDAQGDDVRFVVRWRATHEIVATIDANPGGAVPPWSHEARFTDGDNILISWGCGTYCTSGALFSARGALLY